MKLSLIKRLKTCRHGTKNTTFFVKWFQNDLKNLNSREKNIELNRSLRKLITEKRKKIQKSQWQNAATTQRMCDLHVKSIVKGNNYMGLSIFMAILAPSVCSFKVQGNFEQSDI